MRKMNKIVALSLVLAMALSMMAGAAFKDQATINADLADEISTLVALNVFSAEGTGEGYFEPNGTITRAQAAKIIYVLKNKGVDNKATSWTGLNIFSDVEAGSWYEGYVNYCASTGILAGVGEGKYNPNGTLTGIELAKMLLVVIGYKADIEGYTGANWDANILADAEVAGIFVDYELPVRGIVTREWAAKMIVNAIYATKVKYEDGELTEMYDLNNNPITYAEQNLGLQTVVGQLMANENVYLGKGINEEGKCVVVNDKGTAKFDFEIDNALVGQNVKVIFKGEKLSSAEKIYGVSAAEDVVVLETTMDAIDKDEDLKNYTIYDNYADGSALDKYIGENDGREVVLIDNDGDDKFEIVLTKSVTYGKISYINPSKFMLKATIDNKTVVLAEEEEVYEDIKFVDTVKKGDVVKITTDISTGEAITVIEKLDVVTGTITKVTSAGVATIDGQSLKAHKDHAALAVEKTVLNYYVDKYVVLSDKPEETEEVPTNLAVIIAEGEAPNTDKFGKVDENNPIPMVEVITNDGKVAIYEYDAKIDDTLKADIKVDTIYEYVLEDGKIDFIDLGEYGTAASGEFDIDTNKLGSYRANADTFFFVKTVDEDETTYAVVAASELKKSMNVEAGSNMVKFKDGFNYVAAAILEGEVDEDATTVYGLAANGYESELVDDETIVYIDVTNLDGTVTTLELEGENAETTAKAIKGKFVSYTDAEDVATVNLLSLYKAGVLEYAEGNGLVIDTKEYELDDEAKVYYVDVYGDENKIAITDGEGFPLSEEIDDTEMAKSVMFIVDDEDETIITKIIVEVDGEEIVLP